jgi:hypothetical protein
MPKKTREEKIVSASRKKLKLLQQLDAPQITFEKPELKKSLTQQVVKEEFRPNEKEITLKTFFIKDLRRSLLLSGLIIALEIIIYFGTINNYLKL